MAAPGEATYTIRPAPGVLLGGRVPVGSWAESRRKNSDFQERARRKRQRDAALVEEMRSRAPDGVLRCHARPFEAATAAEAAEAAEAAARAPSPPRQEEASLAARPAPPLRPDARLPYQRLFDPRRAEQYVGNEDSRKRAIDWLRRWKLGAAAQRPRRAAEAMLLLCGPVGTGKSAWALFAARHQDFEVAHFTPGDVGAHSTQKLDFFLRSQPASNVRGQLMLVVLDDVEELLRDCRAALDVRVCCPIIATAGPSVDAGLRARVSLALSFRRLLPFDAAKVVRRIRPDADRAFVKHVVEQAGGDLRQLLIKGSAAGVWASTGCGDLYETAAGRAKLVLQGDPRCRKAQEEEWEYRVSRSDCLVHHNFHKCCSAERFLERYAGFLLAAVTLDAARCAHLMASAARVWRDQKVDRLELDFPPAEFEEPAEAGEACAARQPRAQAVGELEAGPEGEAPDAEPDAEPEFMKKKRWTYRAPRFKPGLQLACDLLRRRRGGPFPTEERQHASGEAMELACLSPSLRLGTDHVDDLLERFGRLAP